MSIKKLRVSNVKPKLWVAGEKKYVKRETDYFLSETRRQPNREFVSDNNDINKLILLL